MTVAFVMRPALVTCQADDLLALAEWTVSTAPHRLAWVLKGEQFVGGLRLDRQERSPAERVDHLMIPAGQLPQLHPHMDIEAARSVLHEHPDWPALPIVRDGRLAGEVTVDLLPAPPSPAPGPDWRGLSREELSPHLFNAMMSGIMVVDARGFLRVLNAHGARILGVRPEQVVDRPYEQVASFLFRTMPEYLAVSAVPRALRGGEGEGERSLALPNGRHVLFRFGTVRRHDQVAAVIITFMDITDVVTAETRARQAWQEVESAFALSLPNTKVEAKLKTSPEYEDLYDPVTGVATVTAVIPDGTYWHVVNGLRLMAELHGIGVFELMSIDKDTLVQAFIFHDIGKQQPTLQLGQPFVPHETFEPGWMHAARSADWAVRYYGVSSDAAWLIRHHHTPRAEIPADFPPTLLPMWHLLKLVDGLSAGLTRRAAHRDPFTLQGSRLTVGERNRDARYHRRYMLSIYTGEETPLPWPPDGENAP